TSWPKSPGFAASSRSSSIGLVAWHNSRSIDVSRIGNPRSFAARLAMADIKRRSSVLDWISWYVGMGSLSYWLGRGGLPAPIIGGSNPSDFTFNQSQQVGGHVAG